MPRDRLQQQLDILTEQLEQSSSLSASAQEQVQELMQQVQLQLKLNAVSAEMPLLDNLEQAVESFAVEHPALAATLRNIMQTLANIGI